MLLWEVYIEEYIVLNDSYLKYTQDCNVHKSYVETNKLTMHIDCKTKCGIDWS